MHYGEPFGNGFLIRKRRPCSKLALKLETDPGSLKLVLKFKTGLQAENWSSTSKRALNFENKHAMHKNGGKVIPCHGIQIKL